MLSKSSSGDTCYSEAREELANVLTHAIGILISFAGLLLMLALSEGNFLRLISSCVFGASLLAVYMSSTIYHAAVDPRKKANLRILDHSAIYLLIAGSYTPIALLSTEKHADFRLLLVIWGLAIAGVSHKFILRERCNRWISLASYLIMGWSAAFAFEPILSSLSREGFHLIVTGGVLYTVGVIFYLWNRLPYNHAIWHLFVLAGSLCHLICVIGHLLTKTF